MIIQVHALETRFIFDSGLNGALDNNNYATTIASSTEVYLRLERSGTTITGYYSSNGLDWVLLGSHTIPLDFQVNGIGLTASQDFFTSVTDTPADFEYFELSSPYTREDFNGPLGEGWIWVNENGSNWNLTEQPGYLRIYVSPYSTGRENLLLQPVTSGYGVFIDNSGGSGAVTIKQVGQWGVENSWAEGNVFSGNYKDGLYIWTKGAVTAGFFQARDNGADGIYIDASGGSGAVSLTGTTNLWGNLSNNGSDGLNITAKGNITISKVDASSNGSYGAYLKNDAGPGTVILTDAYFNNNSYTGLEVKSAGAITWRNGSAFDNRWFGAYLNNLSGIAKPVSVANINAGRNVEIGLKIESRGAVSITDSQSDSNSMNYQPLSYGDQWHDNLTDNQVWSFFGTDGDDVTIKVDSGRFNPHIWVTDPSGEVIASNVGTDGSVTLNFSLTALGTFTYLIHVEAVNNWNGGGYDIKIYEGSEPPSYNYTYSGPNGFYVDNSTGTNAAVTISNASNRWNSNNGGSNIYILSSGAVSLLRMDLNDGGRGLFINNTFPTSGTPGVTLNLVNSYNNNYNGLEIQSKGAVVVMTADLSGNWSSGINVDNSYGSAPSPITFSDVTVNYTSGPGVYLRSHGAITLTNVSSNGNGNQGFDIITPGAVKFTNGWANGNFSDGISIEAGGAISLTNISTNDNGRDPDTGTPINDANGIYLVSTNSLGNSPISLTGVTSNNNTLEGVNIETKGAVTVNTLTTNNNTGWGFYLDQTGAPDSLKAIALNLLNANGNGLDGVNVQSKGNITVNTFFTTGNDNGLLLDNRSGTGSVTLFSTLGIKVDVLMRIEWAARGSHQRRGKCRPIEVMR